MSKTLAECNSTFTFKPNVSLIQTIEDTHYVDSFIIGDEQTLNFLLASQKANCTVKLGVVDGVVKIFQN